MSVLIDEDNVMKIRKAKEIIIAWTTRFTRISDEIGLNLKKLKNGFQTNLWRYCLWISDYKMDFAKKLLDSGSYNVNGRIKNRIQHRKSFHCCLQKKFANVINPNT
jgi:hypothetical protein